MSSDKIENVLILQGGGSLGAFGCGVFKALANHNIKIDTVAGTSIGGLNAIIIAGNKGDHPERELEQFWLELAEGSSANLKLPASNVDSSSVALSPKQSRYCLSMVQHFMEITRWRPEHFFFDPQCLTHNLAHLHVGSH
jgi:predicted acylesterase/phospholipase RssA